MDYSDKHEQLLAACADYKAQTRRVKGEVTAVGFETPEMVGSTHEEVMWVLHQIADAGLTLYFTGDTTCLRG